jgi:hypothetical protein
VEFDADNVTQAVEYLIEFAEDRAQTASYSRVFGAAGLASPQDLHFSGDGDAVTKFMKAVHDHCLDNGLPPLDALVVHVEGPRKGFPGGGYFKVNAIPDPAREHVTAEDQVAGHAAWQAQVEQCRDWGKEHRRQRRRSG